MRAVLVPGAEDTGLIDPLRPLKVLMEKVESFGGRVEDSGPSGIVAAFGLEPVEDAPRRSVLAALAIQNAAERRAEGAEFGVKIGIHIVPVLLRQADSVVEIHPEARQAASTVLDALTAGEPGRILIEASGRGPDRNRLPLGLETIEQALAGQSVWGSAERARAET
jgi:hypothetical protein